ncbi:MAG: murein biosynthesis integral membrane protein MurJ [Candidatus Entotheonellia bacterium]
MKSSGQKILRSTALVMGLTLLAKVSGLLRDIVVASLFGTSQAMDAFFVAVTIATLMYVWLRDPIQVVLVPFFTEQLTSRGERAAWENTSVLINTLLILFFILTAIGWLISPTLVSLIAPGFTDEVETLSAELTKFMMLSLLFYGLARLLSALFYSYQRFGMPGMTTAVDNVAAIIIIACLAPVLGIYALVMGAVLGAVTQVLVQLPILWKSRSYYRLRLELRNPALRRLAWVSFPLLIGTGSAELSRITDRIFASLLPIGSLSALAYGQRLTYATFFQLFVASLTTVLFPFFSKSAGLDNYADLARKLSRSLRLLFWVVFPLSIGIILLHEPIVRLVYQRGAFSEESVELTSQAVLYYAVGLSGYSLSNILSFAFYSVRDTKTPVVTGLVRLGVKIFLSFTLVGSMAHAGLALAESLSFLLKAALLLILLPKELRQNEYRKIFQSFGVTVVITAGMATVVLLSLAYFRGVFEVSHSFSSTALALGAATTLGVGSYLVFSLLLQRTEMRDISRLVRAGFTKS